MSERRVFFYTGTIDDAFKQQATASLIDAGWMPQSEIDGPVQMLACTSPQRQSCTPGATFDWAVVAQR